MRRAWGAGCGAGDLLPVAADREFLRALKVWNNEESGRGVVLIAAAMLDEVLEKCIRAFLVENDATDGLLKGPNAPIGTFSARTNLA